LACGEDKKVPELNTSQWDEFLTHHPHAHLLQTLPWGELKSTFGWDVIRIGISEARVSDVSTKPPAMDMTAGAQILFRHLPFGLRFAYIPKGPVFPLNTDSTLTSLGDPHSLLWQEVDQICKKYRAIFCKVEPDAWESGSMQKTPATGTLPGFIPSQHSIQPPRTLVVNISGEEDQVLGRMRQKTRYNIKLALKKGVVAHPSNDLESFYRLMQETAGRDRFGVHSQAYYRQIYELFYPRGECELLVAEYQGQPLAGLIVFAHGPRAWYLYGASASDHRDRMPTYLLQWEAMRWARSRGCSEYDLWGVPDEEEDLLEKEFTTRQDGLWGVYRFKRGFGGQLRRSAGALDRVYRAPLYHLYQWWIHRQTK
jgi:peptidoglycan pentaglycine glycine transferase (the first glycine)